MIVRVRNLQPQGGSALPIMNFRIEPGFTSPPIDVAEGTPLDEIINTWIDDGIAMVLPLDEKESTSGSIHRQRKTSILSLDQVQTVAKKRELMRKTSLDLSTLQQMPDIDRRKAIPSALKSKVLSVADMKGRTRLDMTGTVAAPVPAPVVAEMVKEAAVVEEKKIPVIVAPPVPVVAPVPVEPIPMEDDDLDEAAEAAEKNARLDACKEKLAEKTRAELFELAEGLGLELKASMLKNDIVEAIAYHVISNDSDDVLD